MKENLRAAGGSDSKWMDASIIFASQTTQQVKETILQLSC
jgi:hypothetical protein